VFQSLEQRDPKCDPVGQRPQVCPESAKTYAGWRPPVTKPSILGAEPRAMTSSRLRRGLGVLVLGGLVTTGVVVSPAATMSALERIVGDPVLFALALAGLYLVRPLVAWPTTPLAVAVGYGYGVLVGVPLALAFLLVTITPTFFGARWVADGTDTPGVSLPFGGVVAWTDDKLTRYFDTAGSIRGVVVSRLLPVHSDVSTCAAATSGVRYRHFLIGTLLGELPWTVAAVFVGASAATVVADGVADLGLLVTGGCLLAALLLLAGPIYRYLGIDLPFASSDRASE
jgi:uncharacterized membrane protein YdjX (TVP38/TMEM64 family)